MAPSSAWERTVRRREVIRLRLGKRMEVPDIAEELGWSEDTIRKDFKWIDSQLSKMQDPDFLREYVMESAMHLMDHETQDLRDADREQDEKAKHRAKQSMRSTMKLINEVAPDGEEVTEEEMDSEEYMEQLPEELKSGLEKHAEKELQDVLENE